MKNVEDMEFDELFETYKKVIHKLARGYQDKIAPIPNESDNVYWLSSRFLYWCDGHKSDWHPSLTIFEDV